MVERASWWNGHLARYQYLVERARCPLYCYSLVDSATPKAKLASHS
ncbi:MULTISPECIES: hypothetical protein [unclassified Moorena]|nr:MULTISPECIES: hypothetical protein [unclassified Moorena]NEQ61849.1 hypothetical protein [Moorena sp. SIO4A1]